MRVSEGCEPTEAQPSKRAGGRNPARESVRDSWAHPLRTYSSGLIPRSIPLGRRTLWSVDELCARIIEEMTR
jgi:hypothetical protein